MLSLKNYKNKEARPIAKVKGGKYKGRTIYVLPHNLGKKGVREMKFPDGKLTRIPNIEEREVNTAVAPSGAGKTYNAKEYIKNYKKIYPDAQVFIFSRKDKDVSIDEVDPIRIPIDDDLVDDPIDFRESFNHDDLILFDDCDTILNDAQRKAVMKIMMDVLEVGRDMNINCFICTHLLQGDERKASRKIINETHTITIFPASGNDHQIDYNLKKYWGMGKKDIEKVKQLDSRAITISKRCPKYVLYDKGVYLI